MRLIRQMVITSAVIAAFAAAPAEAQQTRAQIAAEQRLAKVKDVKPITRNKVEDVLYQITDDFKIERLFNPRKGLFMRFGVPGEGSGFGGGPAWRISNPGEKYSFTVSAAATFTGNWIGEAVFRLPHLADERFFVDAAFVKIGRPTEDFWGLGQQTPDGARTTYLLNQTAIQGTGGVRVTPWLSAGVRVAHLSPAIGRGCDSRYASTTEVFTEETAPGLAAQPDFLRYEVFLDLDYRNSMPPVRTTLSLWQPPLTNARRGGRYYVAFSKYNDRDLDQYSFRRVVVDLQQYVPLLAGHRVFAMRALAMTSEADSGHHVPFYYSPTIGGGNTLRGFSTFRFRDENLVLLQAEYRYHVNAFVTGALFIDAGKVVPRTRDIDFNGLETTYGFGVRLGLFGGAGIRTDLAFGGKSPRLVVGFSNVF